MLLKAPGNIFSARVIQTIAQKFNKLDLNLRKLTEFVTYEELKVMFVIIVQLLNRYTAQHTNTPTLQKTVLRPGVHLYAGGTTMQLEAAAQARARIGTHYIARDHN